MGQVCGKHNQFFETTCRWCPPEPEYPVVSLLKVPKLTPEQRKTMTELIARGGPIQAAPSGAPPPQVSTLGCLHDGALFDFGNVVSCAACGKILPSKPVPDPYRMHDWSPNSMVCQRCGTTAQQMYGMPTGCVGSP